MPAATALFVVVVNINMSFEKTPKNFAIIAIVLFLGFVPYIYFTVVGAKAIQASESKSLDTHNQTACAEAAKQGGGMSLGMWNLLYGSLNLGIYGVAILVILGMLLCFTTENIILCSSDIILTAGAILFIAGVSILNLVWPFYGTYLLTRDGVAQHCKEATPEIYWSTVAGVVFAFLLIIISVVGGVIFAQYQ